jgi:hypothetical protein
MRQSPKQKIVLHAVQRCLQNDYRESIVSALLEEHDQTIQRNPDSMDSCLYIPVKTIR